MGEAASIQREYWEALKQRDFDRARELFHQDYVYTDEAGVDHEADASLGIVDMYTSAFPDWTFDVRRSLEMGDVAVMEATLSGTHQNDLPDVPATGKPVKLDVCNVIEVRDGKIYREHDYSDNLSLMRQLGVAAT